MWKILAFVRMFIYVIKFKKRKCLQKKDVEKHWELILKYCISLLDYRGKKAHQYFRRR